MFWSGSEQTMTFGAMLLEMNSMYWICTLRLVDLSMRPDRGCSLGFLVKTFRHQYVEMLVGVRSCYDEVKRTAETLATGVQMCRYATHVLLFVIFPPLDHLLIF